MNYTRAGLIRNWPLFFGGLFLLYFALFSQVILIPLGITSTEPIIEYRYIHQTKQVQKIYLRVRGDGTVWKGKKKLGELSRLSTLKILFLASLMNLYPSSYIRKYYTVSAMGEEVLISYKIGLLSRTFHLQDYQKPEDMMGKGYASLLYIIYRNCLDPFIATTKTSSSR
ncbi:MAG: hypothetical protein ACK4G3_03045 [bacterium]